MPISDSLYRVLPWICCLALLMPSCRRDSKIYEMNDLTVLPVNSQKNKPKTVSQYISILHTNLFQRAIGPNDMLSALKAVESIGDKQVAFDILVSKYMNDSNVVLPSVEEMRNDTDKFIRETYRRFLVREPTEAELTWMRNYIRSRPTVTPELIYFAFATSNEHFHY